MGEVAGATRADRADAQSEIHPSILREVAPRMLEHGASPAFVQSVCAAIEARRTGGAHILDVAADVIGARFPPAQLARLPGVARILAFTGSTGAGKTTSLVKIALRMSNSGRRVELATLDSHRLGAVEQLRAWSRELEVPLTVMREGVKLNPRGPTGPRVDVVLLDTTGHPASDCAQIAALRQKLEGAPVVIDTYLVLSASSSRAAMEASTSALAPLCPAGVVITKLDETREPAGVLEHALSIGCPLAFLSDGPDVGRHFHRAGPDPCADLMLRGRLS